MTSWKKKCSMCEKSMIVNSIYSFNKRRFCDTCGIARNLELNRLREREKRESWDKLTKEEQLEKMDMVAKRMLEEMNE